MIHRPRRLRTSTALREAVAETHLRVQQLMQPHFVIDDLRGQQAIDAMPGIHRHGIEKLVEQVGRDLDLGIASVLLFGLSTTKDLDGRSAANPDGLIPRAVRALRDRFGDRLVIATDVCLCGSMQHGHCGVLEGGKIKNDATLPLLAAMAMAHARAGADIVAPSDMMDGRVAAIRTHLDQGGCEDTALMSYAVKYASAFYGPFREAANSAPAAGDRKTYQMDARNLRESLREARLDEEEGADMLMVKPALAYLDVIRAVKENTLLPLAAYNVSGEYSMVKAAAAQGWIEEAQVVREILLSMIRAGSDLVITYHGREAREKGWI